MNFRKLRIAWSVGWGLLAAFLLALNVWSCWWWDRCYVPGKNFGVQINSDAGHVVLMIGPSEPTVNKVILGRLPSAGPAGVFYDDDILGFYFKRGSASLRLDIPYWFLVLLVTAIAASPWLSRWSKRYSLRSADRHDAGCGGAGVGGLGIKLTDHVCTIKELIESAAEALNSA
jgi:hypothetical protein